MAKCEHHDDLKDYFKSITENLDIKVEAQSKEIENATRLAEKALEKTDELRDSISNNYAEQKETETYVRSLYKAVDQLTHTVQGMVIKMDQYIEKVAVVTTETEKNTAFAESGKKLVFEIIKWLVLLVLGYSIAK